MNYFLAKTEPSTYSIDDFEKEGTTLWDGVHNHQAITVIKTMHIGDRVFIYHSMSDKKIVGEAEVIGEPFLNSSDERFSWAVEMRFLRRINGPSLQDFKAEPMFANFQLVRQSRLSTMVVPQEVAEWILKF